MLRPTCALAAAEFKQKSRWSSVWPNMRYGAMYLNYSVGRQLPMRGVNWVTRDSNRLTNFAARYSSVIRDVDVKRNEEELNIQMTDIRWNDHRRIYWKCSFCGSSYRKHVSARTKFHAGCNFCKGRYASEVLREQTPVVALKEARPELFDALADSEKKDNIGSLSVTTFDYLVHRQDPRYMSNRFFQKYYLRCGKCAAIQRGAEGYKPIANPILFKSDTHCQNFHDEQRRACGFSGMMVTCRCDRCARVHSNWKLLNAQQFLDAKLSMTREERAQRLWASKS